MPWKLTAFAALIAASAPVSAQSVFDTHAELNVPGGKTPVRIFRPLARDACVAGHRPHQAGKLPMTATPIAHASDCTVTVASARSEVSSKADR